MRGEVKRFGALAPSGNLVVRGRYVTPRGVKEGVIHIENGMIVYLTEDAKGKKIDLDYGRDCLIFPGFIDPHVHMRYGHESKEDVEHFGRAALRGGVTAVVDMPNNPKELAPVGPSRYGSKITAMREKRPAIDVFCYGGITPDGIGSRPYTAPWYKLYTESVGELNFPSMDAIKKTMLAWRGQKVAIHPEHLDVLEACRQMEKHEERRPPEAEVKGIAELAVMAEDYEIDARFCHVSTAASLEYIPPHLSWETTPTYLMINQENRDRFAHPNRLYMNPPLRHKEDSEALIETFMGDKGMLATDHAPHLPEEKDRQGGPAGVPVVEVFGGTIGWMMEEHGMEPESAAEIASGEAADWLGLENYGYIGSGAVGSLTVLRKEKWKMGQPLSKCGWSPWEGYEFPWRVDTTIVRGIAHKVA